MSKKKLIAIFLILTVCLMGVGYAWWSQTLTVQGTVTTGELNVEFIDYNYLVSVGAPYIITNSGLINYSECRLAPYSISPDKHTVTASFQNIFPGMFYSIPFTMENKGTIPAVFRSCTVTSDIDDSTLNGLSEQSLLDQLNSNLKITNMEFLVFNSSDPNPIKRLPFINGDQVSLGDLQSRLNAFLTANPIRLEPGQYVQLSTKSGGFVTFLFSKDFNNDFMNKTFSVSINTQWNQFNAIN